MTFWIAPSSVLYQTVALPSQQEQKVTEQTEPGEVLRFYKLRICRWRPDDQELEVVLC